MKVIILAGGYGSRLEGITEIIPKPMVPIGEMPILWHIMKIYSHYGFDDFLVALGYKGSVIKDFFYRYAMISKDFTIDLSTKDIEFHDGGMADDWRVTLVDTGLDTKKGGRIKRLAKYLRSDVNMLTYGDGLADINPADVLEFHKSHNKILTVTGVYPPSLFGEIVDDGSRVVSFVEKPQTSSGLINGGFMVFDRRMLDYLEDDEECDFESGALEKLAREGQVMVYKHTGSWVCMDSKRDLEYLNRLWKAKQAFWKVWG
ncbi:MAG: glucose-1-phosphate cytidylyltransferase [Chloroflexi bacterium]|nr:glucose-1-phosphate cytidylyltransferase [Chloroflexota bacterium]